MTITGETYQTARARILEGVESKASRAGIHVDLIRVSHWGAPAVLATFEIAGRLAAIVSTDLSGPSPRSPIFGLSASRLAH
jgi:hypothetical protein